MCARQNRSTPSFRALEFACALCLIIGLLDRLAADATNGRLEIYWTDVEGGAATLIVTPSGESVLIDTGLPGERDPGRIEKTVREIAGLERIDHLVITHFDRDHYGGTADLARRVPIGSVYDPGIPQGNDRLSRQLEPYLEATSGKRRVLEPGGRIPLSQKEGAPPFRLDCLGAAQKFLPAPDSTPSNPHCEEHEPKRKDLSQNANSIVLLLSFGSFRMLDAADLTWNLEKELVCPQNGIGTVDVFQIDHHGLDSSNNPVLVRSVAPRVAIINNGPRKGCEPETFRTLKETPSLEAIYQLHRNVRVGDEGNTNSSRIANEAEDCSAEIVALSVAADGGDYTVTVPGRGTAETFETRAALTLRPTEKTAITEIARRSEDLARVNQEIWKLAEVGLEEQRSSELLVSRLEASGFRVERGIAGMPTAFVASYGKGKPVVAVLAEYDALPGMSQQVSGAREALIPGAAGHACGHSGLGAGALGAVLAVKAAIDEHSLPGTVRLYGTPAEETVIGKVYMTLAGVFDDVDTCLHWHPGTHNGVIGSSSKALVSAKFSFAGTPAHASGSPESGRSALDAVELMNVGANFMREHLKEDARIHYVITDGGGAPNVVPPTATVWYYARADSHKDVEYNFRWLREIAEGAAKMTRTRLTVQIDTDCHEIVPNGPLSKLVQENLQAIGAPVFDSEEIAFARSLQKPLIEEFEREFPLALDERIVALALDGEPGKGSTDVGDISWRVPTSGLRTTCFVAECPGHSWQNVATIGSSIGEKGIVYAAKALALTVIDLLEDPALLAAARADFERRMESREYFSFIPDGQAPPRRIR